MSKIIHELQQYEISKVIVKDISWVQKNQNKQPQVEYVPKINMYYWFYYICKYGIEYNKTLELATQDKFKQIEIIRENTSGLKLLKLKKQTFEEDIIYAKHIHISTLKVLAYYNQLSLLVLKNGCYYFLHKHYFLKKHVLQKSTFFMITQAQNQDENDRKWII